MTFYYYPRSHETLLIADLSNARYSPDATQHVLHNQACRWKIFKKPAFHILLWASRNSQASIKSTAVREILTVSKAFDVVISPCTTLYSKVAVSLDA